VPLFLVEGMKRRLGSLSGKKVAGLGLAFKADTDDERDSLAHKLVRLLERELADVAVHDPHVASPTRLRGGGARRGRRRRGREPSRVRTRGCSASRRAGAERSCRPWDVGRGRSSRMRRSSCSHAGGRAAGLS
jgi:hypothetical protein